MSVCAMHVVLIGPMAVGKSAVGEALADLLEVEFSDSDHVLAAEYGPIPQIFARHGESGFRRREADVVAHLLAAAEPSVVSLGGGAVLAEATATLLAEQAVVYLCAPEATIRHRLSGGVARPLLEEGLPAGPSADAAERLDLKMQSWRRILAEREPVYERLAALRLDVDRGTPRQCAGRIVAGLNQLDPAKFTRKQPHLDSEVQ